MKTKYFSPRDRTSTFGNISLALTVVFSLGQPDFAVAKDPMTIILMLKRDVGKDQASPIDSATKAQLELRAGVQLSWMGNTRTNGQILTLPENLSQETAKQIATKLGEVDEVLWAEVNVPAKAAKAAQALARPAQDSRVQELVIKLRGNETPTDEIVFQLSKAAGIQLSLRSRTASGAWIYQLAHPVSQNEAALIEINLESLPRVTYADPVTVKHSRSSGAVTPNDPGFEFEWFLQGTNTYAGSSNVQEAWSITQGTKQVTVAVLDTGILFKPTHPDLAERLTYTNPGETKIAGWDMVSLVWSARDGNGRDPNPKDEGDWVTQATVQNHHGRCDEENISESSWHGSHVAGTIAAKTDNNLGISGINWNATLVPVRVLGACGGSSSDINDGIYWAAGQPGIKGAKTNDYPAHVINMSLGGPGDCEDSDQEAIDFALSKNAVVVVAAGNSAGEAGLESPGNCRGVITVSSVGPKGNLAFYSNYSVGGFVDLSAPGGDKRESDESGILSTVNDSRTRPKGKIMAYGYEQGTSMATPVVSGVVSLMLSADTRNKLTPSKVRTLLQQTARPYPAGTRCAAGGDVANACGAGIVDAYEAVKAVKAIQ